MLGLTAHGAILLRITCQPGSGTQGRPNANRPCCLTGGIHWELVCLREHCYQGRAAISQKGGRRASGAPLCCCCCQAACASRACDLLDLEDRQWDAEQHEGTDWALPGSSEGMCLQRQQYTTVLVPQLQEACCGTAEGCTISASGAPDMTLQREHSLSSNRLPDSMKVGTQPQG